MTWSWGGGQGEEARRGGSGGGGGVCVGGACPAQEDRARPPVLSTAPDVTEVTGPVNLQGPKLLPHSHAVQWSLKNIQELKRLGPSLQSPPAALRTDGPGWSKKLSTLHGFQKKLPTKGGFANSHLPWPLPQTRGPWKCDPLDNV